MDVIPASRRCHSTYCSIVKSVPTLQHTTRTAPTTLTRHALYRCASATLPRRGTSMVTSSHTTQTHCAARLLSTATCFDRVTTATVREVMFVLGSVVSRRNMATAVSPVAISSAIGLYVWGSRGCRPTLCALWQRGCSSTIVEKQCSLLGQRTYS